MPSVSIFGGAPRVTKIVLREQFTGDGSDTTFQLTNSPDNCTFDKGAWTAASIETGYPAHVTGTDKKATYDSLLPLTRHRIAVSSIDASGLVTLDYAPRSDVDFYIWYWYTLSANDEITYYREDFVASMEGEAAVLGSEITLDTTNFDGILSESDTTVQAALETVDDYSGGGGYAIYVEEGDAAKADSSAADLYVDFDGTDFDVGVVGNECNVSLNWARSINLTTVGTHEYQIGGYRALAMPIDNTDIAIGYQTLNAINAGVQHDIAIGYQALYSNTDGQYNIAGGGKALYTNTTGNRNVAFGYRALELNTEGNHNFGLGYRTLSHNTTGETLVGIGTECLYSNTTADGNVGLGYRALYSNTVGYQNVAVGYEAAYKNVGGDYLFALGVGALHDNTSGRSLIAIGREALYKNTTANDSVGIGERAIYNNTTGAGHVAVGKRALYGNTLGVGNIGLGYYAGDNITTGSYNLIVGYEIDAPSATADYQLNIGNTIYGDLAAATKNVTINAATISANYDLMLAGDGVLGLKETTTPTADADYGKIYFKNDNKLYAQTGDGVEHEVAFA